MKADDRTQTNELAESLTRLREGVNSRSLYLYGGGFILIVGAIYFAGYASRLAANARSEAWAAVELANTPKLLEEVGKVNVGTAIGRQATVDLARLLMSVEGLDKLGTPDGDARKLALDNIQKARDLYASVAPQLGNDPTLQQEAWLGAAAAEETLVAAPKAEGEGTRGNIDDVIKYTERAATVLPGSGPTKKAADKVDSLKKNKEQIAKFYGDLYRQLVTPKLQ